MATRKVEGFSVGMHSVVDLKDMETVATRRENVSQRQGKRRQSFRYQSFIYDHCHNNHHHHYHHQPIIITIAPPL